jgi:hypothetical protein
MTQKKKPMRWKKQKYERFYGRGYDLRIGGKRIASVNPKYQGFSRVQDGWYWHARVDLADNLGFVVPLKNTAGSPVGTLEEAKMQCEEYIRQFIDQAKKEERK